jgi:DNA-binding Lrp family transcriptional regulator
MASGHPIGDWQAFEQESIPPAKNHFGVPELAYLLITLNHRTPAAVAQEVRNIEGVVETHITMGEIDIIAVANQSATKGFPGLSAAVQRIDGVAKVLTCVVVRP